MRNRLALAATSVTFIGSTIAVTVAHAPAAAAAKGRHHGTGIGTGTGRAHGVRETGSAGEIGNRSRWTLSAADLRSDEQAGHVAIGTYQPQLATLRGKLISGLDAVRWRPPATQVDAPVAPAEPPAVVNPPVTDGTTAGTADWQCIRVRESGDAYNDPGRPSGAYGILDGTWLSLGYGGWPYEAPPAVQDDAALTLYHLYGWRPWSTRFACGL
ncbi:MAG: hypothetical protein ACRDY3_06155 [Acidimicrobiales bacterium]